MPSSASDALRAIVGRLTAKTEKTLRFDRQPPLNEEFLRRLLRHLPGMAYKCRADADRTMEFASHGCRALTGFNPRDLVEKCVVSYATLIHPDDRPRVADAMLQALVSGGTYNVAYRIRRVDGKERLVWEHGWTVIGDRGETDALEGFVTDIIDHVEVAERGWGRATPHAGPVGHHEAQQLEALSQLAGEVAHDLNNLLTVVKTTAELIALERPHDSALSDDMAAIVSAVDRGSALRRDLLRFGRPTQRVPSTVSLPTMIRDLTPMIERVMGDEIDLQIAIEPDLPNLSMEPTQAEELVMNLVRNALDAMPRGGTLTLSGRRRSHGSTSSPADERERPHVVLTVSSTRVGIPSEARDRPFESYVTARGDHTTGLDLANVWHMVTNLGGAVEADANAGEGSTVQVFLPVGRHGGDAALRP